jgi:Kef-type K+ transport system membrane component KefB
MRPIIAVILLLDVAMFLFVSFTVAFRRSSPDRPPPRWRSLAIPLLAAGWASMKIGERYATGTGVDIVRTSGPVLMGMAIMCVLVAVRQRRGLDAV